MTAVITAPPAAPWAPPHVPLDADAKIDRAVRLGAGVALWLGLLLVTYWWVAGGGIADLAQWEGGLTSVGRLAGLWAADLLLVQVLLMSRLPPLEHAFRRDRLARIHRVVGLLSCYLMISHIVLIIGGRRSTRPNEADRHGAHPVRCRGDLCATHRGDHLVDPRTGEPAQAMPP